MSSPLSFGRLDEEQFCLQLIQALTQVASDEEEIPLSEMDEEFGMEHLHGVRDRLKFCVEHFMGYGAPNAMMEADLKAVHFSFENTLADESRNPGFNGLTKHPSGLVFYGLQAGGDWEYPVCLIVYHDGTQFRAYIPKEGNSFNTATNTAYGSEDYAGVERSSFGGRLPPDLQSNVATMLADIEAAFGVQPAAPKLESIVSSEARTAGASLAPEEFCIRLTEEILAHVAKDSRQTIAQLKNDFASDFNKLAHSPEKTLAYCLSRFLGYGAINAAMEEDFKVIDFDFENVLAGDSDDRVIEGFTGLHTRPNGLVFYGLEAGGDWEYPVAFIIYHDGTQFRGYVPQEGNSFNPATRTAYGSEDHVGAEPHDDPGALEDELEAKADVMIADIDKTFAAPTLSKQAKKAGTVKVSTEDCKALLQADAQVCHAGVSGPWKRLKKFKSGADVVRHFQGKGGFVSVIERSDGTLAVHQIATTADALAGPSAPKAPKP